MNSQTRSRIDGERRAQGSLLRLLCAVSIWRVIMTRMVPLCGASAWWTALICLLPGFCVAMLLRFTMYLTGSVSLTEAMRACLGKAGAVLLSAVLTVLLLVEGISSLTALITLFTQGVGTRGTQFTLTLLTGMVLLCSLHREGLARGAYFLRWMMIAAAILLGAILLADAEPDHLFPLYGDGRASVIAALEAGISLSWTVVLLLTVEPASGQGRLQSTILSAFPAVGAVLVTTLTIPHELFTRQDSLAALMLLPTRYAPNALRVLWLCLLMLGFFQTIGASVQLATVQLCMPLKRVPAWLPYAVLVLLLLTQTADASQLWTLLGRIEPWLLAPLALLALVSWPIALARRKRP